MLLKDFMYSWWCHPLAVDDGTHLWVSGVDRRGVNVVHRGGDRVTLAGPHTADEHNAAALAVDPAQSTVLACYSRHIQDTHIRVQPIDRNTLALGSQQTLEMGGDVTYAQVLHRGATVHLLCRVEVAGDRLWRYRTSADWGQSWGPAKTLIGAAPGGGNAYLTTRVDPADSDLVHLAHYGHPQQSYRDVGYARLDQATGAITTIGGTALGNLDDSGGPDIDPTDMDLPITPSSGYVVRLLDVGVVGGQPAIAYAVWNDVTLSLPPTYKIKRWSGTGWDTVPGWQLAAGDVFGHTPAAHYHGGVGIGEDSSLRTSRLDDGWWIIESWQWTGSTWTLDAEVARSRTRLLRPYPVRGGGWLHQDCLYETFRRYYGDTVT